MNLRDLESAVKKLESGETLERDLQLRICLKAAQAFLRERVLLIKGGFTLAGAVLAGILNIFLVIPGAVVGWLAGRSVVNSGIFTAGIQELMERCANMLDPTVKSGDMKKNEEVDENLEEYKKKLFEDFERYQSEMMKGV
jgi:hypothetical protein